MAAPSSPPEKPSSSNEPPSTAFGRSRLARFAGLDRPRNRLLLFALIGLIAVYGVPLVSAMKGGAFAGQSASAGSPGQVLNSLLEVGLLALFLFPLGFPAALGQRASFCLFCDYQAPQPPLLLPLYCVACLMYFALPIVGSFPAPRRRKLFVVALLIFVALLITNAAGCASISSTPGS